MADSGDQLWERTFHKPPAELALSATLRGQLDRLLRFQRAPCITRVVFIAVPHRGSLLAESFAGRIGRLLIAVPATMLTPVRLVREQVGAALAPDVQEALQEKPTSIKGLSPHNPMIQALAGVAVDKGGPFHMRSRGAGASASQAALGVGGDMHAVHVKPHPQGLRKGMSTAAGPVRFTGGEERYRRMTAARSENLSFLPRVN